MSSNLSIEDIGVGAYLAQERQERGISLAEVSEKTCIRIFYLEKIEADAFKQLPSVPVGRGFVRSYAKYIGVDADEVARFYNQNVGGRSEDIDVELGSKIIYSKADSNEDSKKSIVPVLAVVLFILMSGALLWFVRGKTASLGQLIGFSAPLEKTNRSALNKATGENQKVNERNVVPFNESSNKIKNEIEEPTQKPELRKISSLKKPAENSTASATLPVGTGGAAKPATPAMSDGNRVGVSGRIVPRASRLTLKIKAEEDTWLRVVVDQKEASEIFLTAGSEKNWLGNDKFLLTVGNSKGTKVFLNGASVSLPETTSNVIRDFLITDKVADITPNFAGN